jgi:starch synthase (maltosyl-transferring)
VVVERIRPELDGGRFPVKRTVGDTIDVRADIFADGHDVIDALVRHRARPGPVIPQLSAADAALSDGSGQGIDWIESPMALSAAGTDEWVGRFDVRDPGWHDYQVVAWIDRFQTWRRDLELKFAAGQDVGLDLLEGSLVIRETAARARNREAVWLLDRADALTEHSPMPRRVALALDDELLALMKAHNDRARATASAIRHAWVDRVRARFGAWYEMFPRSAGPDPARSGTFAEAAAELPRIADLGFDVLYLPPIHPIGRTFRKGPNNTPAAGPDDPGSPWAIGAREGGHTAVEPGLGTIADFDLFRAEAERLGLEVALDLAWQASPDHPWVREHPEWFRHRPDGTIKYAENPPKKYQDIYPFDFETDDWRALWQALVDVTRFWIGHGVRIFRVDNPHTKTLRFWEWFIDRIHAEDPDVLFLSEAFTRPAIMRYLAKAGFSQSYTYFTWRVSKSELVAYFTELTATEVAEYLRPNLFANTPDILHGYLQHGGRAAFEARLLLATTLGASYGIYSGFEVCEARALKPGSEEYADSEKYQFRKWQWDRSGHISELVRRVNAIRRAHPALQWDRTLRFHETDNDRIIAYSKTAPDGSDRILTVVSLDPVFMQHGHVNVPVDDDWYVVCDLIDGTEYTWRRGWNYVRFDPGIRQGHILWLPKHRN